MQSTRTGFHHILSLGEKSSGIRNTHSKRRDCEATALSTPVVQTKPSIVKVEISSSDVVQINDPPQSAAGTVTFSINGTVISVAEDVSEQFLGKLVEAVKHGTC